MIQLEGIVDRVQDIVVASQRCVNTVLLLLLLKDGGGVRRGRGRRSGRQAGKTLRKMLPRQAGEAPHL